MKIPVSQAAADDLARLHDFLADKNAVAAGRAIAALISAVQSLETFPERGRPSGTPNVRELIVPFGRSGYVLRYAYRRQTDEVIVLRLRHAREARDPDQTLK
jgi:plasmid stabilization system protein ParE